MRRNRSTRSSGTIAIWRIQERFIADLGKYLDGRPGLEFIDIGSIGEWGEMHLARWTPEMLQQTGFTPTRYIAAYRRMIDAFARAFPHTRVFLNVGDYEAINDYAAIKGLHFRQDGLTPSGPSADVGKRFYRSYAPRGVVCNYELHSGYDEMKSKGWGVRETFTKGLEDPISYLHINLMSYRQLAKAPEDVKQAVTDAARRVGFRFVLTKLRCNKTLRLSGETPARLLLEHTWKNEGVAPCYASYALRWTLTDSLGRNVAEQLVYPARPTTAWGPGEEVTLNDVVTLPANTAPGEYRLMVAMVEPENPSLRVQLGIAGRDAEGRYDLCALSAEKRAASAAVVYDEGFEQGTAGWTATEGMTARPDATAHGGKGCLLISGTQSGKAWNYAQITLKQPVLPASRYRLSCWMQRGQHRRRGAGTVSQNRLVRRQGQVADQHPDQQLRHREARHLAATCRLRGNHSQHSRRPPGDREGQPGRTHCSDDPPGRRADWNCSNRRSRNVPSPGSPATSWEPAVT